MSNRAAIATAFQAEGAASPQQAASGMHPNMCTFPASKSAKLTSTADCAPPEYDDGDYTDSEFGSQPCSRANSRPGSPAPPRPQAGHRPIVDRIKHAKARRYSSHAGDRPSSSGRSHTMTRELVAALAGLGPEATRLFLRLPRTSQSGTSTPPLSARNSSMPGQEGPDAGPGSRDTSRNPSCTMDTADADHTSAQGIRRNIAAARAFATGKSQGSATSSPQGSFVHMPGSARTSASHEERGKFSLSSSFVQPQRSGGSQGAMRPVSPVAEDPTRAPELTDKHRGGGNGSSGNLNRPTGEGQMVRSTGNVHSPLMQVAGVLSSRGQISTAQNSTLVPRPPTTGTSRPPSRKSTFTSGQGLDSPGSGCSSPVPYRRMHTDTCPSVPTCTAGIGAGTLPQTRGMYSGGGSPASNNSPSTSLSGQPVYTDMSKPSARGALRPTSAMSLRRSPTGSGALNPTSVAVAAAPSAAMQGHQRFAVPRTAGQRLQTSHMQVVTPNGITLNDMQRACHSDSGVAQWSPKPPSGPCHEVSSPSAVRAGVGLSRAGTETAPGQQSRPHTAEQLQASRLDGCDDMDTGNMLHADLMDSLHDDIEFQVSCQQMSMQQRTAACQQMSSQQGNAYGKGPVNRSHTVTNLGTWAQARSSAVSSSAATGTVASPAGMSTQHRAQKPPGMLATDPPTLVNVNSASRADGAPRRLPQPSAHQTRSGQNETVVPVKRELFLPSPKVVPPPLAEIERLSGSKPSSRVHSGAATPLLAPGQAQSNLMAGQAQSNPMAWAEQRVSNTLAPECSTSRMPTPERRTPPRTSLPGTDRSAPRLSTNGVEQRSARRSSLTGVERSSHRVSLAGADKGGARRVSQTGAEHAGVRRSLTGAEVVGSQRTSQAGTEMTPHLAAAIALCTTPAQPLLAGRQVVGNSPAHPVGLTVHAPNQPVASSQGTVKQRSEAPNDARAQIGCDDANDADSLAVPPCRLS